MIHIDFQPGTHGNYLEFVCNKIAGIVEPGALPWNSSDAAHEPKYCAEPMFFSAHYSFDVNGVSRERKDRIFKRIISIQIEPNDLLALIQVNMLRAGDYRVDNDQLEVNTFNKLNNIDKRFLLDALMDGFFTNQIRDSYNAVKDPSWPTVNNLDDFNQLPEHIRTECVQQHGLVLLEFSEKNPDCPRSVLRELFKIDFLDPDQHVYINQQKKVTYCQDDDVHIFPFKCFYNRQQFLTELKKAINWAGITYNCEHEISEIHEIFLSKQPYKDSKNKCDQFIHAIQNGRQPRPGKFTMVEEAYVNAVLGWEYFQ